MQIFFSSLLLLQQYSSHRSFPAYVYIYRQIIKHSTRQISPVGRICTYGHLGFPCLELSIDEVVMAADQLEGPFLQPFLDERVGLEVLKGHVDGLLQRRKQVSIQRSKRRVLQRSIRHTQHTTTSGQRQSVCSEYLLQDGALVFERHRGVVGQHLGLRRGADPDPFLHEVAGQEQSNNSQRRFSSTTTTEKVMR
jgi:hypothetical protein